MKRFVWVALGLAGLAATNAFAWGNHTIPAYRAFEKMPEVANAAPVPAESLEAFLKDQEQAIEALLASQDNWGKANLDPYPALPAALAR